MPQLPQLAGSAFSQPVFSLQAYCEPLLKGSMFSAITTPANATIARPASASGIAQIRVFMAYSLLWLLCLIAAVDVGPRVRCPGNRARRELVGGHDQVVVAGVAPGAVE